MESPGIIIRTAEVRETDLIVTILTRDHGALAAVAKGARKSKKRFMGGLDIFDCGTFEFTRLKGDLYRVESLSERQAWRALSEDLCSYSLAAFGVEQVRSYAQVGDAEGRHLFAPLFRLLRNLCAAQGPALKIATCTYFTLIVLKLSGVDPLSTNPDLSEEVLHWCADMFTQRKAFPPKSLEVYKEIVPFLLEYSEESIGHPLKTAPEVLSCLQML